MGGCRGSWTDTYEGLLNEDLVSHFDMEVVLELELFGRLINNTDRHLGNLSVTIDGDLFRLLPAYDMCSMGFAPKRSEIEDFKFDLPELNEQEIVEKGQIGVLHAAAEFWKAIENGPMASTKLREFAVSGNFSGRLSALASSLEQRLKP